MIPTAVDIGEGLTPTDMKRKPAGPSFLKVAPGHRMNIVCLSPIWVGATTHYVGHRMQLHHLDDCPWCANKSQRRFYAWIHAASPNMSDDFIVQLASQMRPVLSKHHDIHGTLRGSPVTLSRPGSNTNSPLILVFTGPPVNSETLLPSADLKRLLLARMDPTMAQTHDETHPDPEASKKEGT